MRTENFSRISQGKFGQNGTKRPKIYLQRTFKGQNGNLGCKFGGSLHRPPAPRARGSAALDAGAAAAGAARAAAAVAPVCRSARAPRPRVPISCVARAALKETMNQFPRSGIASRIPKYAQTLIERSVGRTALRLPHHSWIRSGALRDDKNH